uniref:Uncharacterized protein n=1 Tax=Oryza brachyantha TaxID=4533 RepID=J3LVV6_ORYBR
MAPSYSTAPPPETLKHELNLNSGAAAATSPLNGVSSRMKKLACCCSIALMGGIAEVGSAAVEEEPEAIDGKEVAALGPLTVCPTQRSDLHRRPHPNPFATGGGGC